MVCNVAGKDLDENFQDNASFNYNICKVCACHVLRRKTRRIYTGVLFFFVSVKLQEIFGVEIRQKMLLQFQKKVKKCFHKLFNTWKCICFQPNILICEDLVRKNILWKWDSEYLRSVIIRHKLIIFPIRRCYLKI